MKIYTCTTEIKEVMPNDDGTQNVKIVERTFSNLLKAYNYATGLGKPSGITPSYSSLTRLIKKQGYHPIFGKIFADDVEMPDYFLTHEYRVGIKMQEVE